MTYTYTRPVATLSVAAFAVLWSFGAAAAPAKSAIDILKKKGMDPAALQGVDKELAVPSSMVDAAKKEGTLKFRFNMSPKLYKAMIKPFMERYPFAKIEYTRGVGAGRAVKPLLAFKTGRYVADIVGGFGSSMQGYMDAGALEKMSGLPSFANIPNGMKDTKGYWAGYQLANWCMSYNTNKIKKADLPATWWDLVKAGSPLSGGRVGVGNRAHLWLINLWGAYGGDTIRNKFMPAFFDNLKPQLRKEGINGIMKLASIGEFDVAMPSAAYRVKIQVDKGAPLGFHCPEPVPQYFTEVGIFKNSPRVNTAKLLVNWILSREGQLVQTAVIGSAPIHKDLQNAAYFPYGEEIKGKKVALRTIDLLLNDLPKVYEVWRPAWQKAGGPARKKRGGKKK